MNGKIAAVRVPKKWRSMGHAKANAKLHEQNYEEEKDEAGDCQMGVSFLLGTRHVSPSKESD